jgi:hypothetical protein
LKLILQNGKEIFQKGASYFASLLRDTVPLLEKICPTLQYKEKFVAASKDVIEEEKNVKKQPTAPY